MTDIVRSRGLFSRVGRMTVSSILQEFGVPFNKAGGRRSGGFWLRNEGNLEYILHDFRRITRKHKRLLHPDVGGYAEAFASFSAKCDFVEDRFARHLHTPQNNADILVSKERSKATTIAKAEKWRSTPAGKASSKRAQQKWCAKRTLERQNKTKK